MIHGNGAHETQNISSLRHASHLLTSNPRQRTRMLIHVRRVPLLQLNLSSRTVSTATVRLGGSDEPR